MCRLCGAHCAPLFDGRIMHCWYSCNVLIGVVGEHIDLSGRVH